MAAFHPPAALRQPSRKRNGPTSGRRQISGDPRSQLNYGLILDTRSGLNIDDEAASDWFLKAAQAGISDRAVSRSQAIAGDVSTRSEEHGRQSPHLVAARSGRPVRPDAQAALANYLLRTSPDAAGVGQAKMLLEKSAAAGNRDGKYNLAALLATAPDAANRDPQRALALIDEVKSEFG